MLGGLAAGLGLAWLASSLGLGEEFGQVLMLGLLAWGVMTAIGWFRRSRQAAHGTRQCVTVSVPGRVTGASVKAPATYRPENVGNDASARPWERQRCD